MASISLLYAARSWIVEIRCLDAEKDRLWRGRLTNFEWVPVLKMKCLALTAQGRSCVTFGRPSNRLRTAAGSMPWGIPSNIGCSDCANRFEL